MTENSQVELGARFGVGSEVLRRLHASSIVDPEVVRNILKRLRDGERELTGKRTLRGDAEVATIREILESELAISSRYITRRAGESVFLNFSLEGRSYFFSSVALSLSQSHEPARLSFPSVLYVAERRDRPRRAQDFGSDAPQLVRLSCASEDWSAEASVDDYTAVGLNVQTSLSSPARIGDQLQVEYLDGVLAGHERWAEIRYAGPIERQSGWLRLGLSVSEVPVSSPIEIEKRRTITGSNSLGRARQSLAILSAGAAAISAKIVGRGRSQSSADASIRVVEYRNDRGEKLKGIIDSTGSQRGATAVVIPPAWGRTKETLLPLAATIVETFRRAGESVSVLRFDGTRRRGESHKERGFETPGTEHLKFTFSDAIDDIIASARFLTEASEINASQVVLVTFSAASIEGRRAVLIDEGRNIRGWVSVVGTPDLQSGMRTVSGGIDYIAGGEQEIKFGVQEIMGVLTDVDLFLSDASALRLAFLEDSRRDMAAIRIPVTWIHGANDAWLDLERVRAVMSSGDRSQRRLIEVPTGHQLRSSREALEVFQLVASQVGEMALRRPIEGALPNLTSLETRRRAERERLPNAASDVRRFWKDYLLGRDGALGIELMNATRAFDDLMRLQIKGLGLVAGARIADVGAGTGSFPLLLGDVQDRPSALAIDEIDYVPEGLERARTLLDARRLSGLSLRYVECDLNDAAALTSTFTPSMYDAALLSLVLSYVRDPAEVLRTIYRSLKPGGRIVVSSLRRDADISRLYLEGVDELRQGRAREVLGSGAETLLDESIRSFLNDMARVLDLEEQGVFRFLDPDEIVTLVSKVGFCSLTTSLSFGAPPQAVVIAAEKPSEAP